MSNLFSSPQYRFGVLAALAGSATVASLPLTNLAVRTLAGTGVDATVDGIGTNAAVSPWGIVLAGDKYFFSDAYVIRTLDVTTNEVVTVAGDGNNYNDESSPVDADGTNAAFGLVLDLALHPTDGYLLFTDLGSYRIRKLITTAPYTVSTIAGNGNTVVVDASGTNAQFNSPVAVAISPDGNTAIVVEDDECLLRIIDLSVNPVDVSTLAGSTCGYTDATGALAEFNNPRSVRFFSDGAAVLVGDMNNDLIRHVTVPAGVVTTWCGNGIEDLVDGACATASFAGIITLAITADDAEVFVSDFPIVRRINVATKEVSSVAGSSQGYTDGDSTSAEFGLITGLALSPDESTLVAMDAGSYYIREVYETSTETPTSVPTSVPNANPTSMPTGVPTSAPTEEPVAEHIYVHAVDIHGDGWNNDMYLSVTHDELTEPEYYSLNCACKVVRLFSSSGDMTVSIYRNTTEPGPRGKHVPYEWEALWTIGYSDGVSVEPFHVYGGVDTEVVIDNWNVDAFSGALDWNAHAPKNRCIPPTPPKPKPTSGSGSTNFTNTNSTSSDDDGDALPDPLVNVRLTLLDGDGNAWCDDSGGTHLFTCSRENVLSPHATLPNLLTYPRYFISDSEGRVLMQQGTMRVDTEEDVREVKLPREGSFVFSVSGHYISNAPDRRALSEETLSWDFCGEQGGLGERLHFNMEHGVCKPHYVEQLGELSCEGEWTTGGLLTNPIYSLSASSNLSQIRMGIQVSYIIATVLGMIAIVLLLLNKVRGTSKVEKKNVEFTRLDTSDA